MAASPKDWCRRCGGTRVAKINQWCDECEGQTRRPAPLSTPQAKKLVLDYLITILDFIESTLPEDLSEEDGEERTEADIARVLASICVLRKEFMRRSSPMKRTKPKRVPELLAGKKFVARSHAAATRITPLTQAATEAFASGPEISGGMTSRSSTKPKKKA
jgi:hypothetical protein